MIIDIFRRRRGERPPIEFSSLLASAKNTGVPPDTTNGYRSPVSYPPIFNDEEPLKRQPYFSHLTTESHNGQRPIEVFFGTNDYGTGVPHIGFKLAKTDNHKVVSPDYRDPDKPFSGFGASDEYRGEEQVVDTAYIAYITDGSLHLSRVDYRKGTTPIERNLASVSNNGENGDSKAEIESIIQVLLDNKDNFLSENSGIPPVLVNRNIRPIYDKLEALLKQKQYSIAPTELAALRQAV